MEENLSDEVETDDANKGKHENNNCEERMMKTGSENTERDNIPEKYETSQRNCRIESNNDTDREMITRKQNAESDNNNTNKERITASTALSKNSTERDGRNINDVWKDTSKQKGENIHEELKSKEYVAEINDSTYNTQKTSKYSMTEQRKTDDDARANSGIANHIIQDRPQEQNEFQGNSHLDNYTSARGHNFSDRNFGHNQSETNEVSERNNTDANDTCEYNYGIRSTVSQITATLILNFLNFNYGMVVTMPTLLVGTLDNATALNQTRVDSPQMILNEQQASWLGSILMLFHPVGALLAGHFQESIGRKYVLFSINVPFLICWLLLHVAEHVSILYIACIVMGISLGCCEAPVASYIGEISEPKLRGAISLLTGCASSVGALVIFVLYTYTSWRVTFLLSAIIPSISLSVIGFLPESPVFLVSKNRPEDAKKSLRWLRGWLSTEEDPNSETMRSIEGELKQLIDITNETNSLYINTKIQKHGYSNLVAESSHGDVVSHTGDSKGVVNAGQTCLIMENIKSKERALDNEAGAYSQGHIPNPHNQGGYHENRSLPREENGIEVICQKSTCVKDLESVCQASKCDVEYLHRNSETFHISEMNLNRRYASSQLMKEREQNNNFLRDPIHEDQSNLMTSRKTRGRVKRKNAENEIPGELSYHIVKVKHEKTLRNLVRYTIRNEEIRRPLIMVLTVMTITTISSLSPIRPFLMEIIQTYDDEVNTDDVLIGMSILNILGFFLCAVSINRLGKRRLAMLSLSINAVVSFTLGYFAYKHISESRIPIYCIYINCFLQGYGILQLPWILMSEVFPLEIRGLACGLCAGFSYLLNFCFTKTYLSMTSMFGLAFTLSLYSMTGVVGILYIYFCMPETENKTLHQIQQYFLRRRRLN